MVCETAGALDAWEVPNDKMMLDNWNLVFGVEHRIQDGDFASPLFILVKKLVLLLSLSPPITHLHNVDETRHLCMAAQVC